MSTILSTKRLNLRQFNLNDAQFIIELLNSPGWLAFIGNRHITTWHQAQNYLANVLIKGYETGLGFWLVELKNNSTSIGMCGIIKRDNLENPDIGFAFLPQFMGNSYAYEAANATLNFATTQLQLPCVCAITMHENKSSIKLLEKIGLTFKKNIFFADTNEQLMLFSN